MVTLFAVCLKNGRRFSTGITLPANVAISPGEFFAYGDAHTVASIMDGRTKMYSESLSFHPM